MNTMHESKVIVREFSFRNEKLGTVNLVPKWWIGKRFKKARYGNTGKDITDIDRQAMYNFYRQGISPETIAQNYECTVSYVIEMINTRPWLHPVLTEDNYVNMNWMESDHSDPLELVKLFYPYSVPDEAFEIVAQKKSDKMTWEEYQNSIDVQEIYKEGGMSAVDAFYEEVSRRACLDGINLTFV